MIRFNATSVTVDAAAPDGTPRRTITGIAAPYGVNAVTADGTEIQLAPGALPVDGPNPKLYVNHQSDKAIGTVIARMDTPEGMLFQAKVASTDMGDEALQLAVENVYDQVSVGIIPTKFSYIDGGVMLIESATWQELSLVTHGAFGASASITKVAASIPQNPDETDNNETEPMIEEIEEMQETSAPQAVEAATPTAVLFAQPKREFALPSAAEYIAAYLRGGSEFAAMSANITAAAPDVNTLDGNLSGILPTPIVSPIYNNLVGMRPVIDSVQNRPMPQSGKVFIRPKVTVNVTQGSVTESATIPAGEFTVIDIPVTKGIYGGYVSVSEASIDWSSPEVLGALLDDMQRVYANTTDAVAATALASGATNTQAWFTDTDPSAWVAAIYEAASTILTDSNGNLPNTLWLSPDMWGKLGGLSDDAKRPLFPQVGPMNAFGNLTPGQDAGTAFGLRVVVDRHFDPETLIVGDASGFESWETPKGAISIDNPSQLSRTIAWRGYYSPLMLDASKFIKFD